MAIFLLKIQQKHVLKNVILQIMEIMHFGCAYKSVIQLIMVKIQRGYAYQVAQAIHLLLKTKTDCV